MPHPYQEIDEENLKDYFSEIVEDALWVNYLDDYINVDDDNYNDVVAEFIQIINERIEKYFNEKGVLNCGDYQIVRANELSELTRPNTCGYDTELILNDLQIPEDIKSLQTLNEYDYEIDLTDED